MKQRLREARDRLSDADMLVGKFLPEHSSIPGAEPRYRHVLETDPEYTRKDSLYFHLAETLEKTEQEGRSSALLRAPREGIREERVSARKRSGASTAQAGAEARRRQSDNRVNLAETPEKSDKKAEALLSRNASHVRVITHAS